MTNPIPECSGEVAALRGQMARLSEALGKFCDAWIVCTCRQSIHPALGRDPSCHYHNWHDEIDAGRKALSAVPSDLAEQWQKGQEASIMLDWLITKIGWGCKPPAGGDLLKAWRDTIRIAMQAEAAQSAAQAEAQAGKETV